MNIFVPLPTEDAELCHPVDEDDFLRIAELVDGRPRAETWTPLKMELVRENEGEKLAESDAPWLGANALIFRQAALLAMGPLLRQFGELLPLKCARASLHLYNPTVVLDALDEDASSVMRLRAGKIVLVKKYVFKPAALVGREVFKITSLAVSPTFVIERFVNEWTAAKLRGLEFEQVWSSEA